MMSGDAIEGYYPVIIDPVTFARANDSKVTERLRFQGKTRNLSNLIGTKAVCARCGGKMDALGSARVRVNLNGETKRHYFLYCHNAKMGGGCDHTIGWPYDLVEKPLLDTILPIAMTDQSFQNNDDDIIKREGAVISARALLQNANARIARLLAIIEEDDSDDPAAVLYSQRRIEAREAKEILAAAETALAVARGKVSPAEHLKRVSVVREKMNSEDGEDRYRARAVIKAAIGDLIETMKFNDVSGDIFVLLSGSAGVFLIDRSGSASDLFKFRGKRALPAHEDEFGRPLATEPLPSPAERRVLVDQWNEENRITREKYNL